MAARERVVGATTRRQRISDAETERRTLAAAVALVSEHGLTVSLEHISLEDVIRRADVSRSSAYRRWPYKHEFVNDLLVELARGNRLGLDLGASAAAIQTVLDTHGARPRSAATRRSLVVDLLRAAMEADFESACRSPEHRSYLAVRAAFAGLPAGPTRSAVAEAIAAREAHLVRLRAAMYARTAGLVAYRLAAPLQAPSGFDVMARAVSATFTGMLIAVDAEPALRRERESHALFGSSRGAAWSVAVRALVGVALAYVEPDPACQWDGAGLQRLSGEVRALDVG